MQGLTLEQVSVVEALERVSVEALERVSVEALERVSVEAPEVVSEELEHSHIHKAVEILRYPTRSKIGAGSTADLLLQIESVHTTLL